MIYIYRYILIIDDMMMLIMFVLEYYDLSFFTAIQIKSFNSVNQSIFLGLVLCCILVGVLCCRISTNLRELVGMIRNLSSLKRQCLNTSWTNGTWKDSCPKNVDRKIDIVTSILRDFSGKGENENSGQASYCRYVVHAVAPIWVGFQEESVKISEKKYGWHRG